VRVVVGLGANLGDRLASLRVATSRVAELGAIRARSHVYETEPVLDSAGPPQPRYLNAAVALDTDLAPDALMKALLAIEASMGRVRAEKNASRTIDLDVLWIEDIVCASDVLVVPHPRLAERAFALGPLLEVAPDARDPETHRAYADVAFDRSALHAFDAL
jgi:2-amino-4-hydroxy-6-hydroxymethyldihydropteridine diphosphokinase